MFPPPLLIQCLTKHKNIKIRQSEYTLSISIEMGIFLLSMFANYMRYIKMKTLKSILYFSALILSSSANAASIIITPNPITFSNNVSPEWLVTVNGIWDGSTATFDVSLTGVFSGEPIIWMLAFDGVGVNPLTVTPDIGRTAPGPSPGIFGFESTANGNATYSLDYLPGTVDVGFAVGLTTYTETDTASASISAVPIPAAVWLFGSGLIGLIGVARRKQISSIG